jgi:type IV secretion system protein VirD4
MDAATFQLAEAGALSGMGVIGFAALAARTARNRRLAGHAGLYGTARFQNEVETRRSGLWVSGQPDEAGGVYIGGVQDRKGRTHYLRDTSSGHVLICGPTRSGKGVSCIVPTLLSWGESAIIHDEKGELWQLSAGWRAQYAGNRVVKWEPGALDGSASWNALAEVRLLTAYEVADAQNIALVLIDVQGRGLDAADHWQKAAFQLLTGCILHELYLAHAESRSASLADVAARFADPTSDTSELFEQMRDNTHLNGSPHTVVSAAGRAQIERGDRERAGVTSTLLTHLMLFSDAIVCGNTSRSDFQLSDLADGKAPASVYVVTRGADATRLRPLVRLFLTMSMRHLMSAEIAFADGQPKPAHRFKTLLMLDEFPALGRMELIESALARCAGYGVKVVMAIQDQSQLIGVYGQAQSVTANCHVRACFPTNDLSTAKWLSESTGVTTVLSPKITQSGKLFAAFSQVTKTFHETARPLLTPDEILTMRAAGKDNEGRVTAPGEMLVFSLGQRPIRCEQICYFLDPEFALRAKVAPPKPKTDTP